MISYRAVVPWPHSNVAFFCSFVFSGNGGEKLLPTEGAVPSEPSEVTEANEGSEVTPALTSPFTLPFGHLLTS